MQIDEFTKSHPAKTRATLSPDLRAMAQESVRMEALTGDDTWNHFLSYLEAAVKNCITANNAELKLLCNPALVNDEEIRLHKAKITSLGARIETLNEIILLPAYLKEQAGKAQQALTEAAKDNA